MKCSWISLAIIFQSHTHVLTPRKITKDGAERFVLEQEKRKRRHKPWQFLVTHSLTLYTESLNELMKVCFLIRRLSRLLFFYFYCSVSTISSLINHTFFALPLCCSQAWFPHYLKLVYACGPLTSALLKLFFFFFLLSFLKKFIAAEF